MKVEARVMDVTTTLEGERVGMSIDEGALAHIMSVLTDLYSDPELAVIREYSTNAYDAHVEAGVTRPIEVTLPSNLAPFFRVRDFGFGLDAGDIRNIYSRYGTSTKRESNDVVGTLGLGCKSALTYSDQFTLQGIKNGVCTQVSVSRDEDGGGSMTIVAQYDTDEPSGVEIIVPVNRWNSFDTKSTNFFRFWEKGSVLVNGEEPTRIDGMWIADDIVVTRDVDRSMIVMGNVAYPYPNDHYEPHPFVAFVAIGDVNFTPSREALQMTAKTKATIATLKDRVVAEKNVALQKLIDAAVDNVDAIRIYKEAKALGFSEVPVYKGVDIPQRIELGQGAQGQDIKILMVNRTKGYKSKGWHFEKDLFPLTFNKTLWFTGYDGADFTPTKRKKMFQYLEEKGIENYKFENYALVDKVPAPEWVDPSTIHDWADVAAQKIARPQGTVLRNGRISGSYSALVDGVRVHELQAADINQGNPIFYHVQGDRYNPALAQKKNPNHTIVTLYRNRVNKFQRDFPKAKSLTDYQSKAAQKWFAKLTPDQVSSIRLHLDDHTHRVSQFDAERILDPALKHVIQFSNSGSKLIQDYDLYRNYAVLPETEWENPFDKYILLTQIYFYDKLNTKMIDHLTHYMNAVYSAGEEN